VSRSRLLSWIGLGLVAIAVLVLAAVDDAGPATEADRVQALSEIYACPECDGQSVAESNAAVAANIRDFLRVEVGKGTTDAEIRDRLIASYGTDVLLTPPSEGFSSLIWILPVIVVVMGAAGVAMVVRRDNSSSRTATDDDIELVRSARSSLSSEDDRDPEEGSGR
jgi:cytochrome c-type biogenesis protein CcmH